jgi:hypothetical protein
MSTWGQIVISYMPNISSITGIIVYSFITYVFIFACSHCFSAVLEGPLDFDKKLENRII